MFIAYGLGRLAAVQSTPNSPRSGMQNLGSEPKGLGFVSQHDTVLPNNRNTAPMRYCCYAIGVVSTLYFFFKTNFIIIVLMPLPLLLLFTMHMSPILETTLSYLRRYVII